MSSEYVLQYSTHCVYCILSIYYTVLSRLLLFDQLGSCKTFLHTIEILKHLVEFAFPPRGGGWPCLERCLCDRTGQRQRQKAEAIGERAGEQRSACRGILGQRPPSQEAETILTEGGIFSASTCRPSCLPIAWHCLYIHFCKQGQGQIGRGKSYD